MMKTDKNMNNQAIAGLLKAVAAAYEVKKGNRFKIMAYKRAATAVEHATSELKDYWDNQQLDRLSGIGKNIAAHLDELFKKGRVKHFEKVMSGLPPAMFKLLQVPGVGPKTAYKLCQSLAIKQENKAIERLKRAAEKGKIRAIEGFGKQSEKEILAGLAEFKRRSRRMLLPHAAELAKKMIIYLKKHPRAEKVYPLGSLRRGCATIGDVDLAVKTKFPRAVIDFFIKHPEVKKITAKGKTKASVILKNRRQIDLRVQKKSFGAMLQYFTGSKHHNIHLREIGLKKGMSLSEYGIKFKGKLKEFKTEKEFYQFLKMDWIPPELREDNGEIEAAQKHRLPKLIKPENIKGDFHTHSNFKYQESSHDEGDNSFEAIISEAIRLGYEYIGLADHSPSVTNHSPKQILSLLRRRKDKIEQMKESKKITRKENHENGREIKVLNLLEIDILPNGSLAVPDKGLDLLDFAFVAVHSSMRQSRRKMTERILRALEHPRVKFLAHPTGRLLGRREAYELDWEKIFAFCVQKNKWLEIDSMPNRLDLPDALVKEAIRAGVKLVIGSDAHEAKSMAFLKYGVIVARRGWAEKKDIINSLPWQKLKAIIRVSANKRE